MRKILFAVFLMLCIPLTVFSWTGTTGSTYAVTTEEVDWDVKDIENDVHDHGLSSKRVTISSGYVNDIANIVASSDTKTHNKLDAFYLLYSTTTKKFYILTSTIGDTTITRLDTINTELIKHYVLISSNTAAELAEMIKYYVLTSSGNDTIITRLDTINTELIKQYVLISTNGDVTITRLDTVITDMEKAYILISSNTATILDEMIKHYVLISTVGDTTVARLDTVNQWLDDMFVLFSTSTAGSDAWLEKLFVQQSTAADTTIARLDSLIDVVSDSSTAKSTVYPGTTFPVSDSTAQGSLSSIDINTDNTYNQLKSSVPVFYKVADSTYVYVKAIGNGSYTAKFNVKAISCYAQGGNATILWDSGDAIDIWEGIPFGDGPIDDTFNENVTFTYTLLPPATFSLYIRGIPYK